MVYNITLKPRGMEMGRLMTEGTSSFNGPTPINIAVNLVSNIDGRAMWPERLKFEHPRLCATHERRLFSEYGGRRQSKFSWSPTDRKSTRLNSSHVSISYAVFCLKKNTTNGFRR